MYHFNIQSNIHSPFCLPASMALNAHSYIQTLAIIDFADLSIYSKNKRRQLFSLSYTSSQPVNWTKVSTEALNLIKSFMEIFNFDDMLHGKTMQPETPTRFSSSSALRRVTITSPLREHGQSNPLGELNYMKSPLKSAAPVQPRETQQASSYLNSVSHKVKFI